MFDTIQPTRVAGLSVREYGPATGPSICFLHGGGISGWMWRPQVEALQSEYHCLIPDLPEHGQSANVRPFTIADTAQRIAALIRARGHGGRAHVVGLSEGAQITLQLLSIAPDLVDHALVSSALVRPLPGERLLRPGFIRLIYSLLVVPFRKNNAYIRLNMQWSAGIPGQYFPDFQATVQELTADAFISILFENQRFRLPLGLEHIQVPTLVVAGKNEYAIMRQSARDVVAALPHAQGYLIALGRRLAEEHTWNMNAPDLFNAVLRAWISDQPLPADPAIIPLSHLEK